MVELENSQFEKLNNMITIKKKAHKLPENLSDIALANLNDDPDNEPARITPFHIDELEENEVFVFGSNIHGAHGGGAARFAYEHLGAQWGVGEGLTGKCYALPTMEGEESFRQAVERFLTCAKQHPQKTFLVTPVGCGIAGYTPQQVAPWFKEAIDIYNIYLPKSFWKVLR